MYNTVYMSFLILFSAINPSKCVTMILISSMKQLESKFVMISVYSLTD